MPKFSSKSKLRLATCHQDIQDVFNEVVKHFDCSVLEGHRSEEDQNTANEKGFSQVRWPDSTHNAVPSLGIDVVPDPIDWEDRERFTYFAGVVRGIAWSMGINLRWGGDWDRDTQVNDNKFDDLPHFELVPA